MPASFTCCVCGKTFDEPVTEEQAAEPLVCDSNGGECIRRAREIGWELLLSQYIEVMRDEKGELLFRLKRPPP